MNKLLSQRVAALRQNFRQFEHGGHCFGSDEISAIVQELGAFRDAALALEQQLAGSRSRQEIPTNSRSERAVPIGTFFFVPTSGIRLEKH